MSSSYQYGSSSQQPYGFDSGAAPAAPKVQYICGECAAKVTLNQDDKIRCSVCGHRVMYKERTKRMVQFEAR